MSVSFLEYLKIITGTKEIGDVDQSYQPPGNSSDDAQVSNEIDPSNQSDDIDSSDDLDMSGIDDFIGTGDSHHLNLPLDVFDYQIPIDLEQLDLQIENATVLSTDDLLPMGDHQNQSINLLTNSNPSTIAIGTSESWESVIDGTIWENWSYLDH